MSDTLQFSKSESAFATSLVNTETRERYVLTRDGTLTVGRAEDNTLSLKDDVYASGHHAEIYVDGEVCHVKDLNSRNGTYKNNEPVVGDVTVAIGDIITFGRTRFEIQ